MEADHEVSHTIRRLQETKKFLTNKIRKSIERIEKETKEKIKYEEDLKRNEHQISMSMNPAYGARFIPDGMGIKKPTRRIMLGQIQSLPITATTVFQVNKKLISNNHDSMTRCLEFSKDGLSFVTTCKGGRINLWEALSPKDDPSIIRTINATAGSKQCWPEDVAFFSDKDQLVAVYKNPDVDRQVALVTFGQQNEAENNVKFLIHETTSYLKIKQGVRRVISLPDSNTSRFITAGEDRSVIVWVVGDKVTRTSCHNNWHKNDINGLCRVKNKSVVVSAGLDKRVIGYDLSAQKKESCMPAKDPCLGIVDNPVNPNLLLIHTRTVEKQLTLYDYRKKHTVYDFGWKQNHTQAQSELVSPCWSPSGWYVSTGSSDKEIHIFDIRVNRCDAAQTIKHAHTKRVFKAAWHPHQPLLISISSDHLLGLHALNM